MCILLLEQKLHLYRYKKEKSTAPSFSYSRTGVLMRKNDNEVGAHEACPGRKTWTSAQIESPVVLALTGDSKSLISLRKNMRRSSLANVGLVGVPTLSHLTDGLLSFLLTQLSQHMPIIMPKIKSKQGKH